MTNEIESEAEQLEAALEADQADGGTAGAPPWNEETPKPVQGNPLKKTAPKKKVVKKKTPTPARKIDKPADTLKAQDTARRKAIAQAEADAPGPQDITEEEAREIHRKEDLQTVLVGIAQEILDCETSIEELKLKSREIMAEIYPQTVESDRHVDAVRGYLKSSQEERKNRGVHPARLKELLARAGKAPIDAAFQRARSRGTARPTRSPVGNAGPAAADQAKGATPGAKE
jgi:hypothetical protein